MLMLLIYIVVAAVMISKIERKWLASFYALLTFTAGYVLIALIGYLLVKNGVVRFSPWYEDRATHDQYQAARLILGALQAAFSLCLLKIVLSKPKAKYSLADNARSVLARFKRIFHNELSWRLFLVLQFAGLLAIIYVDITNRNGWDFLPDLLDYRNRFDPDWDLLSSRFWTVRTENWIALFCVLGPSVIATSVGWISTADRTR